MKTPYKISIKKVVRPPEVVTADVIGTVMVILPEVP
jgi:hypothetical protein